MFLLSFLNFFLLTWKCEFKNTIFCHIAEQLVLRNCVYFWTDFFVLIQPLGAPENIDISFK